MCQTLTTLQAHLNRPIFLSPIPTHNIHIGQKPFLWFANIQTKASLLTVSDSQLACVVASGPEY